MHGSENEDKPCVACCRRFLVLAVEIILYQAYISCEIYIKKTLVKAISRKSCKDTPRINHVLQVIHVIFFHVLECFSAAFYQLKPVINGSHSLQGSDTRISGPQTGSTTRLPPGAGHGREGFFVKKWGWGGVTGGTADPSSFH